MTKDTKIVVGFTVGALAICVPLVLLPFFGSRPTRTQESESVTGSESTSVKTNSSPALEASPSKLSAAELVEQGRIAFEAHEWEKTAELWNRLLRDYPNDSRSTMIRKLTPENPITADSPKVMFCMIVAGACKSGTGDVKDMMLALMMMSSANFTDLDKTSKELVTIIMTDLKRAYRDGRMTRDQQQAAVKILGPEMFK
jgi:hypothetical protein